MTRRNSRPPKVAKRNRKEKVESAQIRQTFSLVATVAGQVTPFARIYKGTELKTLSRVRCEIESPSGFDRYWVVFVREKSAKESWNLRVGDQIVLEEAFFFRLPKPPHETEIHAKRFRRFPLDSADCSSDPLLRWEISARGDDQCSNTDKCDDGREL
jgi:hypothetical protein